MARQLQAQNIELDAHTRVLEAEFNDLDRVGREPAARVAAGAGRSVLFESVTTRSGDMCFVIKLWADTSLGLIPL